MADYGQAGALAYEIPQRFLGQQQPGEVVPPNQGIAPQGNYQQAAPGRDLLAERERLTDDYYNNYGVLDSYVKDMAKKGVNVFEPDYTQPGGGEAFKTFQRMQANVLHGANALKVEMEAEKEARKEEALGNIALEPGAQREGLYASNPENFYSTKLSPGVVEANKLLGDEFGTQQEADVANATVRNQQLFHLQEIKKTLQNEGKSTTAVDNDINALLTASKINPALAAAFTRAENSREGREAKSMLPLFENVTNTTRGAFDGRDTVVKGQHYIFAPLHQGDDYGEIQLPKRDSQGNETYITVKRKIKGLLKNNKGVFWQFEDPEIPLQQVDNLPPDEVFRTLVESNSGKYGGAGSLPAFYNELATKGILKNDRTVNPNAVFGGQETAQKANTRPGDRFDVITKAAEDVYGKLQRGDKKDIDIETPQGIYRFEHSDKGVILKDWKNHGYKKNPGAFSYDQYLDTLDKSGFFQAILDRHPNLKSGAGHQVTKQTSPPQTASSSLPVYDETEWKTLKPGEKRLAPDGSILTKK